MFVALFSKPHAPSTTTTVSAQTRDVCHNCEMFCMPVSTRYTPPLPSVYKFYLQMYRHYVNQTPQINCKLRRMEHGKLSPVKMLLYRVASPFAMFRLASPFVMFWSKGALTACTPSRFQLRQRKEARIDNAPFRLHPQPLSACASSPVHSTN